MFRLRPVGPTVPFVLDTQPGVAESAEGSEWIGLTMAS